MSGCHDHGCSTDPSHDPAYRRVLWLALGLNAAMFLVELSAGLAAGSLSLQADALDFLGDAANYGVSLSVLGLALGWRARAALVKALSMGGFGLYVLGRAVAELFGGAAPEPITMGVVGSLALATNVGVALLLYRHRNGDSNRRSVWLCSRNDALSNIAVLFAAAGVFGTGTNWPDLAVAAVMAGLALSSAVQVARHALHELTPHPATR